jgi:hypothetical protein
MDSDYMTARTRLIVRLLDIYADDLRTGTRFEQAVGLLLGDVAAIVVGGDVAGALVAIEGVVKARRELEGEG